MSSNEFRNQLESLYRGEPQAKPSQPIPEEPFRGTNTTQAASQFERTLQNEDGARRAAVERNNAIQDQQQRQIQANRIQQQEQAALDRINRNRLSRDPLELRERLNPRPRTEGITDVGGGGTGRTGGGGSGSIRSGGAIPGGGMGGAEVPGGAPTSAAAPPVRGAAPQMRAPGGGGLAAIGILSALPSELPRLAALAANPLQYWRDEQARQQQEMDRRFGYENPARSGFGEGALRPAAGVVPFTGGQTPGVYYTVDVQFITFSSEGQPSTNLGNPTTLGPIGGARAFIKGNTYSIQVFTNGVWSGFTSTLRLGADGITRRTPQVTIIGIRRADGQPDTGGNPAPVVDPSAPPRPAAAPIRSFYFPPAPSRSPTAVPFNSPTAASEPAPGQRQQPTQTPALTPHSTIAPTVTPEQLKRIMPPNPFVPDAVPSGATQARPSTGLRTTPGTAGGRLGQEGRYDESVSGYFDRIASPPSSNPGTGTGTGTNTQTGNIPGLLPAAALGGALLGGLAIHGWNQSRRSTLPTTGTGTDAGTGTGTGTGTTPGMCRFRDDPYSQGIDTRTRSMEQVDLAIQAYQAAMLTKVDAKLGALLPNGGISGKLGRMGALASKTWNFLQVDRALAVFTWIGVLHNAYMLSNNLFQTLFSVIGNVLDAVGIQKVDEEGNEEAYDINEIVTKYTDDFAKGLFGVEDWTRMKKEWKAFNRIYQAAANITNSLRSITFDMVNMIEQVQNNVGKIGNALKKSGTILQNSFNWMNPNVNFSGNKFFNALNNTGEALEVVDEMASSVLSMQETGRELYNQKTEAEKALSDAQKLITENEDKSRASSVKPDQIITPSDERKAES